MPVVTCNVRTMAAHGLLSPPYRLDWQDSTDEDPQAKSTLIQTLKETTPAVFGTASKLLVAGFEVRLTVNRFLQNRRVYAPKCPMMMMMMMMTMMVP